MRKQLLSIVLFFLISNSILSQTNSIIPKIDKRVEILSMAFRLAGESDFLDNRNSKYTKVIDTHFKKYSNHSFIKYIKVFTDSLKSKNIEYGYWSVEAIAVHLGQPPAFEPIIEINDTSNVDGWEDRTFFTSKFVHLLKQFYKDANCETFFKSQQQYYDSINAECEKQVTKIHLNWINQFLNIKPTENYYPILCLCIKNGGYTRVNFKNNHRNTYTFFECKNFDNNGIPLELKSDYYPRMMLHEYIHCYTNQLVDKYIDKLQNSAEKILENPTVKDRVKNTFYDNWQFLLYESFVRATAIKYLKENNEIDTTLEKEYIIQEKAGFLWIRDFVSVLDIYQTNINKYESIEMLMPKIIDFFKDVEVKINEGKYNNWIEKK